MANNEIKLLVTRSFKSTTRSDNRHENYRDLPIEGTLTVIELEPNKWIISDRFLGKGKSGKTYTINTTFCIDPSDTETEYRFVKDAYTTAYKVHISTGLDKEGNPKVYWNLDKSKSYDNFVQYQVSYLMKVIDNK